MHIIFAYYICIWYLCIWYIYHSNSILHYSKKSADVPRTSRPTNASHPHSRLNLPHPIPSHTYNGLKTFSLSTPIQAVLLHRLSLPSPAPSHTYNGLKTFSFSTTLQAVLLHRLSLPSPAPSHTYNGLKTFSLSTTLQAVLLHRLSLPSSSPSHTYNGLKSFFTLNNPSGRSPTSAQPSTSNTVAYRHKSTKLPHSTTKHSGPMSRFSTS